MRVGRFQPAGMASALELFALLPEKNEARAAAFESALSAFERGNWDVAESGFAALGEQDGPASFLRDLARRHAASPPAEWSGVIALNQK